MQAAAGEVERAIRDGAAADALIGALESELSGVVGALRDALGVAAAGAAADEAPAADAADAQRVLQKLEAYLADSDGETADYLATHAPALRAALGADRFAGIRKAVEEYDFGDALDRLRGAAATQR